jgi:hypothetical protein
MLYQENIWQPCQGLAWRSDRVEFDFIISTRVRLDKSVLQKYNGNITQGGQMGL